MKVIAPTNKEINEYFTRGINHRIVEEYLDVYSYLRDKDLPRDMVNIKHIIKNVFKSKLNTEWVYNRFKTATF